jgi:hypothetical protein
MLREQLLLVYLEQERAIETMPSLVGVDAMDRKAALDVLHRTLATRSGMTSEGKRRLARIEANFDIKSEKTSKAEVPHA